MTPDRRSTKVSNYIRKWLKRGDTGALVEEIDLVSSEAGGSAEQLTAYDTDTVVIADASIPAGKRFILKNFFLLNYEAFNIHIRLWDGTIAAGTQKLNFSVSAYGTYTVTDIVGMIFTTSVNFEIESSIPVGSAFSAGAGLAVGGYLIDA